MRLETAVRDPKILICAVRKRNAPSTNVLFETANVHNAERTALDGDDEALTLLEAAVDEKVRICAQRKRDRDRPGPPRAAPQCPTRMRRNWPSQPPWLLWSLVAGLPPCLGNPFFA